MESVAAVRVISAGAAARRTIATAESVTGGLLGATLTGVPGASEVYRGGLITYATDVKSLLGGVDAEVLARHGAVSWQTAEALALGAARSCRADIGIALTGVAGPTAQEGQPVGTVWLGWCAHQTAGPGFSTGHELLQLSGGRDEVRRVAVERALERLAKVLEAGE